MRSAELVISLFFLLCSIGALRADENRITFIRPECTASSTIQHETIVDSHSLRLIKPESVFDLGAQFSWIERMERAKAGGPLPEFSDLSPSQKDCYCEKLNVRLKQIEDFYFRLYECAEAHASHHDFDNERQKFSCGYKLSRRLRAAADSVYTAPAQPCSEPLPFMFSYLLWRTNGLMPQGYRKGFGPFNKDFELPNIPYTGLDLFGISRITTLSGPLASRTTIRIAR